MKKLSKSAELVVITKKIKAILLLIFIFAFAVRVINLGSIPDAIDEDEMALGYYSYSLLHGGTDEYGTKTPIYFESIGDYKYGLYSYFSIPSVGIFGLSPFSTRLTSATAGAISAVAIFYLALELMGSVPVALLSALLLSISPLNIHFSRVAYGEVLGLLFTLLYGLFYVRFYKKQTRKYFLLSLVFLLLSIFTFQAYRVFIPAFSLVVAGFLFVKKRLSKSMLLLVLSVLLITFISFIPKESRVRSQSSSTLINQAKITEQVSEDGISGSGALTARIFHNKAIVFFYDLTSRYLSYFDPVFIFREASGPSSRHTIPETGIKLLVSLPFIFIGLLGIVKFGKKQLSALVVIWILTGPVAAAAVAEARSPWRMIATDPGLVMVEAVGLYIFVKYFGRIISKVVILIIIGAFTFNFAFFLHQYFVHKPIHHPWYNDVGLKEVVSLVSNKYYGDYNNIVVTAGHYIPFLFYNKVTPTEFLSKSVILPKDVAAWHRVSSYDKLIFNMPYDCPVAGKKNVLYVCSGYKVPIKARLLEVIRFKDDQPAFVLVDFLGETKTKTITLPPRVEYDQSTDKRFSDGIIPAEYQYFWPM